MVEEIPVAEELLVLELLDDNVASDGTHFVEERSSHGAVVRNTGMMEVVDTRNSVEVDGRRNNAIDDGEDS